MYVSHIHDHDTLKHRYKIHTRTRERVNIKFWSDGSNEYVGMGWDGVGTGRSG